MSTTQQHHATTPAHQLGGLTRTAVRISDLPKSRLYDEDGNPRADAPACITCGQPVIGDADHTNCRQLDRSLLTYATEELVREIGPLGIWKRVYAGWEGANPAQLVRVIWVLDRANRVQMYCDLIIRKKEAYGLSQVGDRVTVDERPAGGPTDADRAWLREQ